MAVVRWIVITALAVGFLLMSVANWTLVPFHLPDGGIEPVRLPLLLAAAFVAGWLPTWLVHIAAVAGWKRRLAKAGRPGAATAFEMPGAIDALPAQAQPIIVPPGA